MEVVDVFSDASQRGDVYSGAYMIGFYGPCGIIVPRPCASSMDAELIVSAIAVEKALSFHPSARLVVHSDLKEIRRLLQRQRMHGARLLKAVLGLATVYEIHTDGRFHREHWRCHHMARVKAGIYGTKHPWYEKGVVAAPPLTTNRPKRWADL